MDFSVCPHSTQHCNDTAGWFLSVQEFLSTAFVEKLYGTREKWLIFPYRKINTKKKKIMEKCVCLYNLVSGKEAKNIQN